MSHGDKMQRKQDKLYEETPDCKETILLLKNAVSDLENILDDKDMAIKKINTYEQNGILLGKNLILTYETKKNPLNSKTIKLIIQHYLKN